MDILDLAAINYKSATIDRLQQQMEISRQIKAEGDTSSARRLAEMREMEQARLADLAEQQRQKRNRELINVLVALGIGIVVIGVMIYFMFGGG
jgi:Flp pilus assembly protein TadB